MSFPISTGENQLISPFQYAAILVLGIPPPTTVATAPNMIVIIYNI